ncbi:filamentous hemagglutinin N-terminal domain-containing protein [Vibrio kyushuensis]|uniref:two-partner secretion domain-containing protein n=1 Tax=Vibrio kyushuensis TaxID=2910249 RepID=UPI003D0B3121
MTQSNKRASLDKPVKSWQRHLTYLVCTLINVQPVLANVVVSGGNTHTITAGNGVEVVNIATPNGKGLSHNKYQQFNVDKNGLILNNSAEQLAKSQLGGYLQNNPNLNNGAASVILNEVTGTSRSQLNGYTEVFGSAAPVILTNPYGITCNGCGFINTPRVTLSTGTPNIINGELEGFDVSQGSVTIEGLGLDGTNQTYFDIISRTAKINADIHANALTIVTGNNEVAYQSNEVTKTNTAKTPASDMAIDSSLLGGMYAGRIALVATENGVGVNVGRLAASQGDITISADGKIVLGDASATQDIALASNQDIEIQGTLSAERHLDVQADNTSVLSEIVVGEDVTMRSDTLVLSGASIEAKALNAVIDNVSLDDASLISTEALNLGHLTTLTNDGDISASQSAFLSGDGISLTGQGKLQTAQLEMSASSVSIDTALLSTQATLDIDNTLTISNEGSLSSTKDVQLNAKTLVLEGQIQSGQSVTATVQEGMTVTGSLLATDITIESQALTQKGDLAATNNLSITTGEVALEAQASAGNNLNIQATDVTLSDTLKAGSELTIGADNTLTQTGQGSVLAGKAIHLNAKSINLSGESHSNGSTSVNAQDITLDGTHQAQGDVTVSSKTLTQEGQLAAGGELTLTQTDRATLSGEVASGDALTINTKTLHQSGELTSGADLSLTATDTTLEGNTSVGGTLTIETSTLAVTGQVLAAGDTTLTADNLTLSGELKTAKSLSINTSDSLTTAAGSKLEAEQALTLEAATLNHQGAMLSGNDTVITSNNIIHKGQIQSGQSTSIDTQTMTQQGSIEANQNLTLVVNSALSNQGDLLAGNDMSLSAHSLVNTADINAGNQTTLTTTQGLTNQSSGVISGLNTDINASSVSNAGTLQALESLNLTASSLSNSGALIALTNLTTQLSGTLTNNGLIYAGNNANLYNNRLNNYSDILVGNDLTIATNASLQKSTSLLNSSATIESLGGDISIYTGALTNKRTELVIDYASSKDESSKYGTVLHGAGTQYAPEYDIREEHLSNSSDNNNRRVYHYTLLTDSALSIPVIIEKQVLKKATSASRIIANDAISIQATTLKNNASQIAGKNVQILASSLENTGYQFDEYTTYYEYELPDRVYRHNTKGYRGVDYNLVDTRRVKTGSSSALNSSITATNRVTLNVANQVNNSTIQSNASKVTASGSNKNTKSTGSANVAGPAGVIVTGVDSIDNVSISFPAINSIPFPEFRLPSSPNGLFIFSDGPSSGYLIETNPALTNLGNFLGSDYFQDSVGFSPEQDITFLGDAFYDTRTITQAIFEQTGQRYLNQSVGNDFTQMKQLIDAAAGQKQALDLDVGIALSAEQVASLTQDMVWYETIEVNGQEVLAPKLYLAQVSERDFTGGAVIAGGGLEINAGDINNSGTLSSDSSLTLKSDGTLLNDTGTIAAGGDLIVQADGDIINRSGQISGENVALVSQSGSVINETLTDQLNVDKDGNIKDADAAGIEYTDTYIGQTAGIKASNELVIQAGDSITNIGGELSSGSTLTLIASNDINLSSVEDKDYLTYKQNGATTEKSTVGYQDSNIASGGSLNIITGGDLTATGGQIKAADNAALDIAGDLTFLTNETLQHDSYDAARLKTIRTTTGQEGVTLSAGNNLTVSTGGDATLVAANVNAANDLTFDVEGQLAAIAATETAYSRDFIETSSVWGDSSSDTEIQTNTVKGTAFKAGGSINLTSQGDQIHQASDIAASGDVTLESTQGSLALVAAEESRSYRHETVDSGFMVTMAGEGETSSTQKITRIKSGGKVSLAGALGIQVDYVSTDGQLARALNELPAGEEYAWMAALKGNPNVDWNQVNEAFDSWDYEESNLGGPAAAIIAIALTVVTAGAAAGAGAAIAGSVGAAGTAAGSTVAAMGAAATSTLITQTSLSLINNGGDLGATLEDLGSSDKVKLLATAMLTAGALAGFDAAIGVTDGTINVDTGLPNYSSVDATKLASGNPNISTPWQSLSPDAILQQVGRSGIQAGVDSAINGTDFSDGFVNSLRGGLANNVGAIAANQIGDWGVTHGLAEGGFTKSLLHGVSQGAVAELAGGEFIAGAAAGVATELAGSTLGNSGLEEKTQVDVAGLIGAAAGVAATGDAEGAYTGQNAGGIVHRFNHLNHDEAQELMEAERQCQNGNEACDRASELKQLDSKRDVELLTACNGGNSALCNNLTLLAKDNRQSYVDATLDLLKDSDILTYQMPNDLQEHFYKADKISNDPTGQQAETVNAVISGMIDFMPGVGDAKGFYEANTGFEYLLATVGLVPALGDLVKQAGKAFDAGDVGLAQDLLAQAQKGLKDEPKLLEYKPEINNAGPSGANPDTIANSPNGPPSHSESKTDFYVRPDGDVIPGSGYRITGGNANIDELNTGTIASREPTYITFDDVTQLTPNQAQDLLQTPHAPTHVVEFDTIQLLDDLRIPDGKWNTNSVPEPITETFPDWGKGGGTQAITDRPIQVSPENITELRSD